MGLVVVVVGLGVVIVVVDLVAVVEVVVLVYDLVSYPGSMLEGIYARLAAVAAKQNSVLQVVW